MERILIFTIAIAVSLGTTAVLASSGARAGLHPSTEQMATDGAFRDGLYLGRLASEQGEPAHAAIGRWSTAKDRASFAAGYQRGYARSSTRAGE